MKVFISCCDPAWENRVYEHAKFEILWNLKFDSFVPKHSLALKLLYVATTHNGEFHAIYRTCMAYTKCEIME